MQCRSRAQYVSICCLHFIFGKITLSINSYIIWLGWEWHELTHLRHSDQCQAHVKCSINVADSIWVGIFSILLTRISSVTHMALCMARENNPETTINTCTYRYNSNYLCPQSCKWLQICVRSQCYWSVDYTTIENIFKNCFMLIYVK